MSSNNNTDIRQMQPPDNNAVDNLGSTETSNHIPLQGIFRIGGHRNWNVATKTKDLSLVCTRFWNGDILNAGISEDGVHILEVFPLTNDQQFLDKVRNNYLHIELSRCSKKHSKNDIVGSLRLPLHQFFIAYRDANITNRLCNEQFPVISTDAWITISCPSKGEKIGEVECLLAVGTDKQIERFIRSRRWQANGISLPSTGDTSPSDTRTNTGMSNSKLIKSNMEPETSTKKTSDLLNMLQKSLAATPSNISQQFDHFRERSLESFRICLEVKSARNLHLNPSINIKNKLKRPTASKGRHSRLHHDDEPSSYVTFQANEGHGPMIKSHEGMVYSTDVTENSYNPIWNRSFYISVPLDYLVTKNKRFILKVWKKVTKRTGNARTLPTPMEDSIIGFASIDFTGFLGSSSVIDEWFNIVDFNGHICGQIKVSVQPLDDAQKLIDSIEHKRENQVDHLLDSFESSMSINNVNLSRAIKRKFTELEEISQRLRARLFDVTGSADSDADSAEIDDKQLDEFEHDLNTEVSEDEDGFAV